MKHAGIVSALAVVVLALSVRAVHTQTPPKYTVTDLGTLGGATSTATAINGANQVVGLSLTGQNDSSGQRISHALLATNGQMVDLGTLGGNNSAAFGINARGQVIGRAQDRNGNFLAFLWNPTARNSTQGTMVSLGTLPGGRYSGATDINDFGQVVGVSNSAASPAEGFVWTPAEDGVTGTMFSLGAPYFPEGINVVGQITGSFLPPPDQPQRQRPFLFTPHVPHGSTGTILDLGVGQGFDAAFGFDVNDAGQVAGFDFSVASNAQRGFLFSGGERMQLPTLGGDVSAAFALNNGPVASEGRAGGGGPTVVGRSTTAAGLFHGVEYDDKGVVDVNSEIFAAGLAITQVVAINQSGNLAATAVDNSGNERAVLLDQQNSRGGLLTITKLGNQRAIWLGQFVIYNIRVKNNTANPLDIKISDLGPSVLESEGSLLAFTSVTTTKGRVTTTPEHHTVGLRRSR